MVSKTVSVLATLSLAAVVLVPFASARRGAPTICFPVLTGDSLRFPVDVDCQPTGDTSATKVVAATLDTMHTSTSALERMEALRRGVMYVMRGSDSAKQLTLLRDSLTGDVLDAEALSKPDVDRARAWFNLGYANAIFTDTDALGERGGATHAQSVARTTRYLAKAIALAPQDAQMHVGAAFAHAKQSDARDVLFLEHSLTAWKSADRLARMNVEDALRRFEPGLLAPAADDVTKNLEHALVKAQKAITKNA